MKILKRLLVLSLITLINSSFFALSPAPALTLNGISAHGQKAIEQISTCINSEGKDSLNVLYLIDESGSLQKTDPNSLRVDGLKASLEQFRNVSIERPYFKVNRAISTFADKYNIQRNWDELDGKQLDSDLSWISNEIPNLNRGQWTDWMLALTEAYKQFSAKRSATSCDVMVWFTDGAIQLQKNSETTNAMKKICGVDPVTGNKIGESIIDKFRVSGINIQGILLQNSDFFSNPTKYGEDRDTADIVEKGMTYFKPILEATGSVGTEYFGGQGSKNFSCGNDVGAAGVLQTIGDPIDILWFPVPFNCLATNGRILPIENGSVKIDPGMTKFQVTSVKNGFELSNGAGDLIANSQGPSKGQVQVQDLGQSGTVTTVKGNIANQGILKPGVWRIKSADTGRAVFCGYLDLQIEIKGKTCYENEPCEFSGKISRNGREVNFGEFRNLNLSFTALKPNGTEGTSGNLNLNKVDGTYSGKYLTNGLVDQSGISKLKVNLRVTTNSGYEFSISAIKDFAIVPPGLYPEIIPNPIKKVNFSEGLVGINGKAKANLVLKGPSRTNGEICISNLQIRSDVLPDRIPDYESALNGENLADNPCFALGAGKSETVTLEITNRKSANGTSSGFLNLILKSDGKPDIKSKIDVEFETSELHDIVKGILIFVLVLLIGIGLPLGLFYLVNALGAKIQLSQLSMATVPVILNASGGFVNLTRKEPGKGSGILTYDDFNGFKHATEKVKEVAIGSELLRGRAPKNPFGQIKAILTTQPGYVVVSSEINTHGDKGLNRNQTIASLNPSGKMHIALSEASLAALKQQNQGNTDSPGQVEANLVTLMTFTSMDPNQEVDSLNMKLSAQTGWLDKLLKLPEPPAPEMPKKVKTNKGKKSQEVSLPVQQSNDDWGQMTTPTQEIGTSSDSVTQNKPTDSWGTNSNSSDWGNSSTDSDWGSSSSGNSSKDDW